ncbi:MAG: TetR/AcrR family transcriptional regulator, partial [Acidimicrobiaceae bacterium]|nr:TetR/AcrR family transcriptional regulator [Acidimicrobiaceae bacterium]
MPRVTEATRTEHRRRLLEAAAAEFAAKGLDGARVDDISLAAGLGKGTIYNYFESKHEVFREVVLAWFTRITETLEPVPEDAPIRDQLLSILRADMQVSSEIEDFARVMYREA